MKPFPSHKLCHNPTVVQYRCLYFLYFITRLLYEPYPVNSSLFTLRCHAYMCICVTSVSRIYAFHTPWITRHSINNEKRPWEDRCSGNAHSHPALLKHCILLVFYLIVCHRRWLVGCCWISTHMLDAATKTFDAYIDDSFFVYQPDLYQIF